MLDAVFTKYIFVQPPTFEGFTDFSKSMPFLNSNFTHTNLGSGADQEFAIAHPHGGMAEHKSAFEHHRAEAGRVILGTSIERHATVEAGFDLESAFCFDTTNARAEVCLVWPIQALLCVSDIACV